MKSSNHNSSSGNLHKRIKAYSAMAGAFVTLTPASQAAVVHTEIDPDTMIFSGTTLFIDLNGDQINDISLMAESDSTFYTGTSVQLNLAMAFVGSGNAIAGASSTYSTFGGSTTTYQIAYGLNPGIPISNSMSFNSGTEPHVLGQYLVSYGTWMGNFVDVVDKFLGVRFLINGNVHYGWVRLDVELSGASAPKITVKGYAYEDVPNTQIATSLINSVLSDAVSNLGVADVADNGNGQDLSVSFDKAGDESKVGEYRVIVVKSADAAGFDLTAANIVAASNYTPIVPNGGNISQVLTSTAKDKDGDLIANQEAYKVFVLSVADGVNATINELSTASLEITLTAIQLCQEQNIAINPGWNMVSTYITPDTPDVLSMVSAISTDILLVKNGQGLAAIPAFAINSIGDWNVLEGYKIKSSNVTTLVVGCQQVDPVANAIILPPGWSIIAYLRTTPLDAAAALAGIAANALLVKNSLGSAYIPAFGINTIGDLMPGQGYQVKMNGLDTLTYAANDSTGKMSLAGNYSNPTEPTYFNIFNKHTGHNSTIIVPASAVNGLQPGDEIGVFNEDNQLSGSGVFEGGNMAITVWGDDPTTAETEGLKVGDKLNYKIWRRHNGAFSSTFAYSWGPGQYENDGISLLKKLQPFPENNTTEPSINIYPNPFYDQIVIDLVTSKTETLNIAVFDIYGKRIMENRTNITKGLNSKKLDLSGLSSGVHFVVFRTNNYVNSIKVERY